MRIFIQAKPLLVLQTRDGMSRYKRPANEPLTGLCSGPLTAQFYLLFLIGPLTSSYQFLKSLSTFIFLLNVIVRS